MGVQREGKHRRPGPGLPGGQQGEPAVTGTVALLRDAAVTGTVALLRDENIGKIANGRVCLVTKRTGDTVPLYCPPGIG
ncbi:hypothetical protein [Streptomyces canus]|uniref:Uncharacterized protein n=1 Tax=Streptomyces canus TaxID=58343 RepID=A0AAW8FAL1_9ACTN|nr:hypothetical protein [Streptomyces canus]MDQ0764373.1 hypothetical protein [Streptomyces canus]MDQ0907172.1 hypothetical protein [Streptomyces canus]MDQ1067184.1 hypothetical protein [Streptomyces canus]